MLEDGDRRQRIRMLKHNNNDHMQYRMHLIRVLMLVGCFFLLLVMNHTRNDVVVAVGLKNVTNITLVDTMKYTEPTDKIIIEPQIMDIINKTFYDAVNETALLLDYKYLNNTMIIYNYSIPSMKSASETQVIFTRPMYDEYVKNQIVIHNHIPKGSCKPSNQDKSNPDYGFAIYCRYDQLILFYFKGDEMSDRIYFKGDSYNATSLYYKI